MSFSKFVLKSSFRKRSRTIFTLIGITIPVVIILIFGMIIGSMNDMTLTPNSDILIVGVFKTNANGIPLINEDLVGKLKDENGIEKSVGGL
ncbi:MAG: hypothetical protein LBC39_05585 [Methanobrevibacter sp.]|nr:hypothetical protein [Candidatus Methanovirga aequatorialis]